MLSFGPNEARLTGMGAERLSAGHERIVVIGAGGWLGLATLELLHRALGDAFEARVVAFGSGERLLELRDGLSVPQSPLARLGELSAQPTLVLHLAFLTKDRATAMPAEAYIEANRRISTSVLGALDGIGAMSIFVPSSGAVYGVDDEAASDAARLYGRLKLDDERIFDGWAARAGARVVTARVFNLSGPYINKLSSYALSAFILDALAGRPIEIKATRPVHRSYVAIRELMSVVFGLMHDGTSGGVLFDTAGERPYEMADIAEAVRAAFGRSDLPIHRPPMQSGPPDVYVGDAALYSELRRSQGVEAVDFPSQVGETARYMAELAATSARAVLSAR